MLKIEHFLCNPVFRENCWLAHSGGSALLVDPGVMDAREFAPLAEAFRSEGLKLEAIFITHGHFDHIYGVNRCLEAFGRVPVYMSPADVEFQGMARTMAAPYGELPDDVKFDTVDAVGGDVIEAAGCRWEVISTPGHSKGGICFHCREEKVLFSGDTLFAGSIGRTDLHGGDYSELIVSIMDRLMGLDGDTVVLSGHGRPSTIADERTHNPFLEPWGEKEQEGIDWDADGIELHG